MPDIPKHKLEITSVEPFNSRMIRAYPIAIQIQYIDREK